MRTATQLALVVGFVLLTVLLGRKAVGGSTDAPSEEAGQEA